MGPGLTPNAEHELMMATRLPCERKYVLHGTSRAQNLYYITQIRGHATIDFEVAADGDIAVCFVPGMVFYQLNQRQLLRDKGLCPCQNTRTCKASKTLLNPKLPYLLYVVTSGKHVGHSYMDMLRSFKPVHVRVSVAGSDPWLSGPPPWLFMVLCFAGVFGAMVYGEYSQQQLKPYHEYKKVAANRKRQIAAAEGEEDALSGQELTLEEDHSDPSGLSYGSAS